MHDEVFLYGYTLIDEWIVERWEVRVEDFCTVFNSNESFASDSLAGENSYVFTTLKERNMWADIQDKRLRDKLDKLDDKLINLIKIRTDLVNDVLKLKQFKKDIIDKKRISIILKNILIKSRNRKIDPIITKKIWKTMIRAFIDYEFRNFKKK